MKDTCSNRGIKMGSTQMHHILGISDKRSKEISKEVTAALVETGKVDEGTQRLMETYDTESMLAGMRLQALVRITTQMHNRITEGKLKATKQNADLN